MQDSWQEFQDILHWVINPKWKFGTNRRTSHKTPSAQTTLAPASAGTHFSISEHILKALIVFF